MTVFYDGKCPYCRTEIKWYQLLDKKKKIHWIDITDNTANLSMHNINYDKAMSELHVIGDDGQRYVGVEGFFAIWSKLPFYRVIASLFKRLPFVVYFLDKVYKKFAVWRIKRKNNDGLQ